MNPYEQAIEAINSEYGLLINDDVPFTRFTILEALKQASERLQVPNFTELRENNDC